ncbi:MAG: tetratricopeptide repeat protein, partial [Planctomycetes bacterium]|nr:tetratricopeptide repeat protein [Planctomycetota bacterium]
ISNIKIKDKCSDGRIIVKRGTKDWEILAGPNASGTGATCYEPHTTGWYVYAAGKPHPVILAHELFHGLFKLKDEDDCRCIMRGTQVVGYEITALCDDKSHKESGKNCWARLLERYPDVRLSEYQNTRLSEPPALKVTKEHRKEFETKQEEIINKTLQLEGAAIYFFESDNVNKVIPVCLEKLKVRPDDAAAYYNIACAYALMDKPKEAIENLKKAVDNGFDDYEWLKEDADLVSLNAY